MKIANGLDLNDSINMRSAGGQSPSPEFVGTDSIDKSPNLILHHADQIPNSRNDNLQKLNNIGGSKNLNLTHESISHDLQSSFGNIP